MALAKVTFGGQSQGSGTWSDTFATNDALFLKIFGGEVFSAFEKYNVTMDKHRVRSISSGKSAQFPFTGRIGARRFQPGSDILADNALAVGGGDDYDSSTTPGDGTKGINPLLGVGKVAEQVINIDELMISSVFIDDLDSAKSHYDYRGPFSTELGRALAHEFDKQVLGAALNSAVASASATDPFASSYEDEAAVNTEAGIIDAMFKMAQNFDEKYVPESDRYAFVTPATYYKLIHNAGTPGSLVNSDYASRNANGIETGSVYQVAGMQIVKCPHLPQTDTRYDLPGESSVNANPGENNNYQGNRTGLLALCWHPEAVGTVKLKDITLESEYIIQRQGTLMVSKMATGHGGLRPECVGTIATQSLE